MPKRTETKLKDKIAAVVDLVLGDWYHRLNKVAEDFVISVVEIKAHPWSVMGKLHEDKNALASMLPNPLCAHLVSYVPTVALFAVVPPFPSSISGAHLILTAKGHDIVTFAYSDLPISIRDTIFVTFEAIRKGYIPKKMPFYEPLRTLLNLLADGDAPPAIRYAAETVKANLNFKPTIEDENLKSLILQGILLFGKDKEKIAEFVLLKLKR